jgi:hypothetical protein
VRTFSHSTKITKESAFVKHFFPFSGSQALAGKQQPVAYSRPIIEKAARYQCQISADARTSQYLNQSGIETAKQYRARAKIREKSRYVRIGSRHSQPA